MVEGIFFCIGKLRELDYFSKHLRIGAEARGIATYIIDENNKETLREDILTKFAEDRECVAVLLNQIGLRLRTADGANFWSKNRIPVYSFQLDHPRNYYADLFAPVCDLRVICLDRNHIHFVKRFYPRIKIIHFLPNGGTDERGFFDTDGWKDRDIDVIYAGGIQQSFKEYPALEKLPDNGRNFYQECIAMILNNPELTTEDAIDHVLSGLDSELDEQSIYYIHMECAPYIEGFVRREFKLRTMQALDQAGIRVTILGGNTWDLGGLELKNASLLPRITPQECNLQMQRAKVSLNCMPWYKAGCSERVFNSMMNGAVCVTDRSSYLEERFKDGSELVYYDLWNLTQLAYDIRYLLNNIEAAQQIAYRGYRETNAADSWESRMGTILQFVNEDMTR